MSQTLTLGRRWSRLIPLVLIGALFVALLASGALKHLSLDELKTYQLELTGLVARHPWFSLGAFTGVYVLLVSACVPGPGVMTIAGGFLFGPWIGGAASLTACVAGSVIVFLACRTAFGDWAATRAGPTVAKVEAGFSQNAFFYLLALRLMPVAPMFLVNIAASLARVRLATLVAATVIGTAPSSFIYAWLGSGLGEVFQRRAPLDASLLAQPRIILPLAGLALMSAAPAVWRLWRARRR